MPELSDILKILVLDAVVLLPAITMLWRAAKQIARLEFRVEQLESDRSESNALLEQHLREGAEIRERLARVETKLDLLLRANGQ